jgi:hypothetical protein
MQLICGERFFVLSDSVSNKSDAVGQWSWCSSSRFKAWSVTFESNQPPEGNWGLGHYGKVQRLRVSGGMAGPLPTLLSSIQERERRKTALQHELWELDSLDQIGRIDETKLAEQIESKLRTQWRRVMESEKHVSIVRQLLRHTLVGRVRVGLEDASHYVITGKATFVALLDGMLPKCMASHLIANWNPFLNWLGEVSLLKETLPIKALDGQDLEFRADSPVPY